MNLAKLYEKLPVSKHGNIRVLNNHVIYDDGTKIYQALIDETGELVPLDVATRNILKALET